MKTSTVTKIKLYQGNNLFDEDETTFNVNPSYLEYKLFRQYEENPVEGELKATMQVGDGPVKTFVLQPNVSFIEITSFTDSEDEKTEQWISEQKNPESVRFYIRNLQEDMQGGDTLAQAEARYQTSLMNNLRDGVISPIEFTDMRFALTDAVVRITLETVPGYFPDHK